MKHKIVIYLICWLIFHLFLNIKFRNMLKSQNIGSLLNSTILVIYFIFLKYLNKTDNILIFISFYMIDILYYIVYYITDLDIKECNFILKRNIIKKKKDRILYSGHHFLSLILLYFFLNNINNEIIYKYGNIFIFLFEISTVFLNLELILEKKFYFKLVFFISRCLLLNYFLYQFILKKKESNIICSIILIFLSIYSLYYIILEIN